MRVTTSNVKNVKEEPIDEEDFNAGTADGVSAVPPSTAAHQTPPNVHSDGDTTMNEADHGSSTMQPPSNSQQQRDSSSGSTIRNDDLMQDSYNDHDNTAVTPEAAPAFNESRTLIKAIQNLGDLGIDGTLPSLPKIIVVGDQSHGKSSMIEAVCDISLPRSSGTCTRCPFEIVTNTADLWTCSVSIVTKWLYTPDARGRPGWPKLDTPRIFKFGETTDKHGLERILRLAQVAVLSPDRDPAAVRKADDPSQSTSVGFSPNIIRLEIGSPELPELSLYDLPGAINLTERPEDQHFVDFVDFVDSLLKYYIKEQKSIVLLTVAANADVETCKTFTIIRRENAIARCMGVITKPDLIDSSATHRVQKMLNGQSWKLQHKWFVTKQLSQWELDQGTITNAEARKIESDLFATPPWCNMPPSSRAQFGTGNLQRALSHKLIAHILADLPEIRARIAAKLGDVEDELAGFPEPAKAPALEVIREVDSIAGCIEKNIKGSCLQNGFRDGYKVITTTQLCKDFREARPRLTLATPGFKAPAICVDSDGEMTGTPTPSPVPAPRSAKSRKGNDGRAVGTPTPIRSRKLPNDTSIKTEENGIVAAAFDLAQVREAYTSGNNAGIPDALSPEVTNMLSLQCLKSVHHIITKALDEVKQFMAKSFAEWIQTTLASRPGTKLLEEVLGIVEMVFVEAFDAENKSILDDVSRELYFPIVTDAGAFRLKKDAKRAELLQTRTLRRVNEYFDVEDAKKTSGKQTPREERVKHADSKTWVEKTLGSDRENDMIEAMVVPLAYYDIASSRLSDLVKMKLEYGVMRPLQQDLKQKLLECLHVDDLDYCAGLLAEDPAREQRRQELLAEKAKYLQAFEELDRCRDAAEV